MIVVKKHENQGWETYPFYVATATKIDRNSIGLTKEEALKNLRVVIREENNLIFENKK